MTMVSSACGVSSIADDCTVASDPAIASPLQFREPPASLVRASTRLSGHPKHHCWTSAVSKDVVNHHDDSPGFGHQSGTHSIKEARGCIY